MKPSPSLSLLAFCCLSACGGGGSDDHSSSSGPVESPVTTEIAIKGKDLYSVNGNLFIPRGINLQYGDNPTAALPAIDEIAATGANLVRLQLRKNTSATELKQALDAIVAKGMVAMPMYWEEDITCKQEVKPLTDAVATLWLDRWQSVLLDPAYSGHIMLNIANEWGSSQDYSSFVSTYKQLIGQFRQAGFKMPLVIDGVDCGQNPDSFQSKRYASLQGADELKNLVFSLHAYHDKWNSRAKVESTMDSYQKQSLPLLIGEFGDSEFQADGGHSVDHLQLMASAQQRDLGWIAWSWHGNGSGYQVLDMSSQHAPANLTRRGTDIVYDNAGLPTAQPIR